MALMLSFSADDRSGLDRQIADYAAALNQLDDILEDQSGENPGTGQINYAPGRLAPAVVVAKLRRTRKVSPAVPASPADAAADHAAADDTTAQRSLGTDQSRSGDHVDAGTEAGGEQLDASAAGAGGHNEGGPSPAEEQVGEPALEAGEPGGEVSDQARAAPDLATVQGLAKALGAKSGVAPVQAVFKACGVRTAADISADAIPALVAAFNAELAK